MLFSGFLTRQAWLVVAVTLCAAPLVGAQSVQLKSGAIIVGDVEIAENGDISVKTRFPDEGVVTFRRSELTPRSLYDLLSRRVDLRNPEARLELAEFAESEGLLGLAVADYLAVSELAPDLKPEMLERAKGVREKIADSILENARELRADGNPRAALMHLHTLQERFGETAAAREGKKLMGTTHELVGRSTDVAKKTVSEQEAQSVIASLRIDLEKGDRSAAELRGHEGSTYKDRKLAERAIAYFEAAWSKIRSLPVAVRDAELREQISRLRESGKRRLADAYLTAGSIHLQNNSIPRAEEYCNKACELMPDQKSNHDLHRLIIQAKITNGRFRR